jgi:two-component system, cell cycle sensor histidine kinase and response regulator CckA
MSLPDSSVAPPLRAGLVTTAADRAQALADASLTPLWTTDAEGGLLHANPAWCALTGRFLPQQLGAGWLQAFTPETRALLKLHLATRPAILIQLRLHLRAADGGMRLVLLHGQPLHDPDGRCLGHAGTCQDLSERHAIETRLAYRAITQTTLADFARFALAPQPLRVLQPEACRLVAEILRLESSLVFMLAPDGADFRVTARVGDVATVADTLLADAPPPGIDAPRTLHYVPSADAPADYFPGRELARVLRAASGLAAPIYDAGVLRGFLVGLSGAHRDFGREATDFIEAIASLLGTAHHRERAEAALRASEQHLLQSQKMEAVGLLAGGVAHDFNNLLTAIRCYGELLHDEVAPALRDRTAEIMRATQRASALTGQLLIFSRKHPPQPELIDLNLSIASLRELLSSFFSEHVNLVITPAPEPAHVEVDRNQLDQVVINLCLNARDAMPHGGTLTIHVRLVTLGLDNQHNLPAGPHVCIEVADTGTGMVLEVQARLFQPFFTTKPAGRGTGLGLANCALIAKTAHGAIAFRSALGHGTTFQMYLPRVEPGLPGLDFVVEGEAPRGHAHILLVEDDEVVRAVARTLLGTLGYKVTAPAGGAEEILEMFAATPPPRFDLLLSDVVMPLINGYELSEQIVARQPDLPRMFMSGHTNSPELLARVRAGEFVFLEKPFSRETLARKVAEALARGVRRA